jgi:RNA polymerase I-specific transcription initiation factor RRN7
MEKRRAAKPIQIVRHLSVFFFSCSHCLCKKKKVYHGKRGRFLYFQCQQLVLRQQIVALIELWKVPPEYEASMSSFPLALPLFICIGQILCRDIWALHLSLLPNPPPDHSEKGEESEGSSSDENGESDADHPLGVNSGSDSSLSPSKTKHWKPNRKYDGLASTIAVLALACWTMRLPVLYRDFIR